MFGAAELEEARTKTARSIALAMLIVIMDMSGMSGSLTTELEDGADRLETLSGLNSPGFMQGLANQSTTFSLSEGNNGGCAVLDNGQLACWGGPGYSRIFSNNSGSITPVVRSGFPAGQQVESVSLGEAHHCVTMSNDKVYCWGYSHAAGASSDAYNPTAVSDRYGNTLLADVVDSGSQHSCAILTNGSTVCWGRNYAGQIGVGYRCVTGTEGICAEGASDGYIETPTEVALPSGRTAIGLSIWLDSSCFILDNKSLYCAGAVASNNGNPTYVIRSADKGIYAMSLDNAYANDGLAYEVEEANPPYLTEDPREVDVIWDVIAGSAVDTGERDVRFENVVSAGLQNNWGCALLANGSVLCDWTQPDNEGVTSETWFDVPASLSVAAISIWYENVCLVYSNGSAQCWGTNHNGQTGSGYACTYGEQDPNDCDNSNRVGTPRWVALPAGRHISIGEADDDGDGVWDLLDSCPTSTVTWSSDPSTDYDGDGCRDSDEDNDDDNDGYTDNIDAYPLDSRFHQNLTMADGWIAGGRYENVSVTCGENCGNPGSAVILESSTGRSAGANPFDGDYYSSTSAHRSLGFGGGNIAIGLDGNPVNLNSPSTNHSLNSNSEAVAIAGNGDEFCAIMGDGQAICKHYDNSGQNYQETNLSFPFPDNYPAKHVSWAQNSRYCLVLENSAVYCGHPNENISLNWVKLNLPQNKTVVSTNIVSWGSPLGGSATLCVVFSDGNASCRGENGFGQLGTGDTNTRTEFSPVYFPSGISSEIQTMAIARYSSCALFDNGSVYCWGKNDQGQLGDGTVCASGDYQNNCNGNYAKPIIYDPVIMPAGQSAIALWHTDSSGDEGYCTFLTNGGIWCWGNTNSNANMNGGLNDGNGYYIDTDGYFLKPGNRDWDGDGVWNTIDNCAGGTQGWTTSVSVDFDRDGCIDATEDTDDDGDSYSDAIEASCGTDPLNASDIPIDWDGDGICNAFDTDDDGDGIPDVNDELPGDPNGFTIFSLGDGFQSGQPQDNATLGNTKDSACVSLTDQSLRCWGLNTHGEMGDGTSGSTVYSPTNVSIPQSKTVASLSSSSLSETMCAVMGDGSLYCWGENDYGQMGIGTKCTYGSYINGCNGREGVSNPSPVQLPSGRTATAVSLGEGHACAIMDDGSVWCWGNNEEGQLGVGNTSNSGSWRYSPNQVLTPTGVTASAITAGLKHSCLVATDGRVFCWGFGDAGRLGIGSQNSQIIPTQVSTNSLFVSISAGESHTCGITDLGEALCWGSGWQGVLGNGDLNEYWTPEPVSLPSGTVVVSITTGYDHTCVVTEDKDLYCWGSDDNNRLNTEYICSGSDITNGCYYDSRVMPAISQTPTGAVASVAGYSFTCAILANGGVYCSGGLPYRLANGTYVSSIGYVGHYVTMPIGITPVKNDRDIDHDGVFNNEDDCMDGETGWTSNSSTDNDSDGCRDATEDLDDDNDYLNDTAEATAGTNSTNPDTDGDGYLDGLDDFPLDGSEWLDTDGDGVGDNTDTDDDGDGWSDSAEYYCLTDPLNGTDVPSDNDGDGSCDLTDTDDDNDGTLDNVDDFPFDAGADTDTDGDGMPDTLVANYTGNLTEDMDDDNDGWNDTVEVSCGNDPLSAGDVPTDTDGDSVCDPNDAFPSDPLEWDDTDGDGVGDNSDAFPSDSNETADYDGDGIGDNADPDDDNDGWDDIDEVLCLTEPQDATSIPGDIDSDGICDALEQDLDNDGWSNANETICGTDWQDVNSVPLDTDGDWICDIMDYDDDGDGWLDDQDAYPLDPQEWLDTDGDGVGNNADPDDDNDGCMDVTDDLPLDPTECVDTDGDGVGNNVDTDDDGDGLPDSVDPFPMDGAATLDTDGDGMPDFLNGSSTTGLIADPDDDNDGWNDTDDAFPLDPTEWMDTDGDGIGNNQDVNDDGDNCPDVIDDFPLDPSECTDTDGDGIGNNADTDDDNDGWLDGTEMACGAFDPLNASSVPDDNDGDSVCDLMDADDDNDSFVDSSDAFPFDHCASRDTDGDGMPDQILLNCNTTLVEDWDDDNDGYDDANDSFPEDPTEWEDTDWDGIGNNADPDDDGDTVPDDYDEFPLNSTEWADNDGDGIGDNADTDDDNDGTSDDNDDFPYDYGADTDTDGDGMPDTLVVGYNGTLTEDQDDDGDGVLDVFDAFPLDDTEWSDTDGDGIGNNADSDDDGDGWSDSDEFICGTDSLDNSSAPLDTDGDGICDSEDDDNGGPTTLGARLIEIIYQPVMMWMLVVGVVASLVMGMTATAIALRRENNPALYRDSRDATSAVSRESSEWTTEGIQDYAPPSSSQTTGSKEDKVKQLVNQGYSPEVAMAIAENDD